jgi:hypothetical protein
MYIGTRAGAALRRTASAGECLGRSMCPKQIGLTPLPAAAVTTVQTGCCTLIEQLSAHSSDPTRLHGGQSA